MIFWEFGVEKQQESQLELTSNAKRKPFLLYMH
jgi:hypothetical protein